MRVTLAGLAVAALLSPPPGDAGTQHAGAQQAVRRLEARHRAARDLTARFVQTYRSGVLGQEIVESGTLSLKRPGRMRWEYREPEPKTFIADGEVFYFYVPADRQVVVREQGGQRGVAVTLLSGEQSILERFSASLEPGSGRLELVPLEPDPDVTRVWLELDDEARIRSIEVIDVQANRSRFRFHEIRENVGLGEELFQFEVPRGVEVVKG